MPIVNVGDRIDLRYVNADGTRSNRFRRLVALDVSELAVNPQDLDALIRVRNEDTGEETYVLLGDWIGWTDGDESRHPS